MGRTGNLYMVSANSKDVIKTVFAWLISKTKVTKFKTHPEASLYGYLKKLPYMHGLCLGNDMISVTERATMLFGISSIDKNRTYHRFEM